MIGNIGRGRSAQNSTATGWSHPGPLSLSQPHTRPAPASGCDAAAAAEVRPDPVRMVYGETPWRSGHSTRTPVGAPTNGRDSSHLGGHSDRCRAPGPSWDSFSRSKTTTRLGAGVPHWPHSSGPRYICRRPAGRTRDGQGEEPGRTADLGETAGAHLRRPLAGNPHRARSRLTPPVQPVRRKDDLNPTRLAYGDPPPRHDRLSPRTTANVLGRRPPRSTPLDSMLGSGFRTETVAAIEAYERHASRFQGFAARWASES
jgi:hypothetical protein